MTDIFGLRINREARRNAVCPDACSRILTRRSFASATLKARAPYASPDLQVSGNHNASTGNLCHRFILFFYSNRCVVRRRVNGLPAANGESECLIDPKYA